MMRLFKSNMILLFLLLGMVAQAQVPTPAPAQTEPILLMNGRAHIGNGEVIENSAILIVEGKIKMVADARVIKLKPIDGKTIDIQGKDVYPGFIAPRTTLGLAEVSAVRATRDFDELGEMTPSVRTAIAYDAASKIIPTVRSNGVLLAQVMPTGGLISGTSSIMQLDAWNWEDAVYQLDDGLFISWPNKRIPKPWWDDDAEEKLDQNRQDKIEQLHLAFAEAKAYSEQTGSHPTNVKLEAMKGLFDGTKRLFIRTHTAADITAAVLFAEEHGVKHIIIAGGRDAWQITDFLKAHNVAVILSKPHNLPSHPEDPVDLPYRTPALLQEAGVMYCISYDATNAATGVRNLPFMAGTAATYGLTKEQAIQAITSNTAKILGIDATTGTLEEGKDATLFISSGDALDMRTNKVEHAFIQGREIDLSNHQVELYEQYKEKYGQ